MIELLGKLPDQLIGATLAAGLWFGFHYLVLADRAMERQAAAELVPACEADVARMQNRSDAVLAPLEGLRQLPFGGQTLAMVQQQFRLSGIERRAICECSARRSRQAVRFDYAIHTASLRLIEPASVADLRGGTIAVLRSQVCGALPWIKG
ncbi:hypothetical protein STVA_28020 [Allostella vacuolata]|nr:hypothetical protein STVA_28020 [Stella vacuolata]